LVLNGKGKNNIYSLKKGDTIGLVAPGSPGPRKVIKKGIDVLNSMGFDVILGKNVFKVSDHTAGFAEDRADDINNFFSNPKIKAIIAIRGGHNCNQILPFLDYELIKKNTKIFLGLSDVTVVLNAITSRSDITTFHGPVLLMIGGGEDGKAFSNFSKENFKRIFMNKKEKIINIADIFDRWVTLKKGKAVGKLFGGNLDSLVNIIGTPYEPNWENAIFMWETLETRPEIIDQSLTHLKLAGIFDKINGMMVGFINSNQNINKEITKIILRQFNDYKFPIVYGVDFGHGNDNLILPIGGKVDLDTEKNTLKIIKY